MMESMAFVIFQVKLWFTSSHSFRVYSPSPKNQISLSNEFEFQIWGEFSFFFFWKKKLFRLILSFRGGAKQERFFLQE